MERICYYCKHSYLGNTTTDWRCSYRPRAVETSDTCNDFESLEEYDED